MTETPQPGASPPGRSRLEAAAAFRRELLTGVLVLAGAFAVLAAFFLYRLVAANLRMTLGPLTGWLAACACACAYVALSRKSERDGAQLSDAEDLRLRLLGLGGGLGLLTTLFGFVLPFTTYHAVFSGGLKEWRANPWALGLTGLALFGGLVLMFVSLQLARGAERSSQTMRRLLYGYNAVLTTLLVAAILGVLNLLAYSRVGPFAFFSKSFDWTTTGIYTLSDQTKALLGGLRQPVRVYAILRQDDRAMPAVEALLNNFRSASDQFSWEALSPDRNRRAVADLLKQYPFVTDPYGLLVVYGTGPNAQADFVKYDDIYTEGFSPMGGGGGSKPTFKGENGLVKALVYLAENKTKAVVYFTQGNGELDVNDRGAGAGREDNGLGVLRDRLASSNYDVKELIFGPGVKAVPDDADVVVVARPGGNGRPMPDAAVGALRDFASGAGRKKKGKLVVLFDVVTQQDGGWVRTGLEGLMGQYNVRVGDDRVMSLALVLQTDDPTFLLVQANPASNNPVAKAFADQSDRLTRFLFIDARTVSPAFASPGGQYTAETLVQTVRGSGSWAETDPAADPVALAERLLRDERELVKKVAPAEQNPLSLAVTVSEGAGPPPGLPMEHPPVRESRPVMAAFGDATWVTNKVLRGRAGSTNFGLFASTLSWLRERPEIGRQVPDKEREEYRVDLTDEQASRIVWLPALLMLLAVFGLAGGVWVVRRR
jgi:hypothetical protein